MKDESEIKNALYLDFKLEGQEFDFCYTIGLSKRIGTVPFECQKYVCS